jgi:hypothetical protein
VGRSIESTAELRDGAAAIVDCVTVESTRQRSVSSVSPSASSSGTKHATVVVVVEIVTAGDVVVAVVVVVVAIPLSDANSTDLSSGPEYCSRDPTAYRTSPTALALAFQ